QVATTRRLDAAADARRLASQRVALSHSVTFSPRPGAVDVAPDAAIVVSVATGELADVVVTAPDGRTVTGRLDASERAWRAQGRLAATSLYRITANVQRAGMAATVTSTFRTMTPAVAVGATIYPSDGMTVGVGQPVVIRFDHAVTSDATRAAALSHFRISETKPAPG